MSRSGSAYAGIAPSSRSRRLLTSVAVIAALLGGLLALASSPAQAVATTVSGTLIGPDGPAVNVAVRTDPSTGAAVLTDAAGHFSLPVPAWTPLRVCWGLDRVGAGDPTYVSACSTTFYVPVGQTENIDASLDRGGSLTGQVTADSGGPLAGIGVRVYRRIFSWGVFVLQDGVRTDTSGRYRLTVPPGTYRIRFVDPESRGLAEEYYPDAPDLLSAADVPVGLADTVTADAGLAATATLSGHVASSDPYRFLPWRRSVTLYDAETGRVARRASLGRDNDYSIADLFPGTYTVAFNRLSGYAEDAAQFYSGTAENDGLAQAQQITVGPDTNITGIDATLSPGGWIRGTLVDTEGHSLKHCDVQAYTLDRHLVTRSAGTTFDGSFEIGGLATGRYYVKVLSPKGHRDRCDGGRQWLAGRGGAMAQHFADADVIAVTQGRDTALSRALVYQRGASISGSVRLPAGDVRPADRQVVVRNRATGRVAGRAVALQDGSYSIRGLLSGTYRVSFARVSAMALAAPQFYDGQEEGRGPDAASDVSLTLGQARSGVNARLALGGSIAGRLVDPAGRPLDHCLVQAYTTDRSLITRSGLSDADGRFNLGGLSTGDYRLRVIGRGRSDCRGPDRFLVDGAAVLGTDRAQAREVSVVLGRQTVPGTRDLVFTSTEGSLGGRVTLASGDLPREDRHVVVRSTTTGAARHGRIARDGTWLVAGLAADTYRVTFDRLSGQAFAAAQFFERRPESAGTGSARPITLSIGQSRSGIDGTLTEGGHLTGYLHDTTGAAADCQVQAFTPDGSLVTRTAQTRYQDGHFDIGGLSTGSYAVRVVPSYGCRGAVQVVVDSAGGSLGAAGATPALIPVTTGATTAIPVALVYGVTLPPISNLALPTISGTPVQGSILTADPGTWRPGVIDAAYQWYADTTTIAGATGATFTPSPSQHGQALRVAVTVSRAGYASTTRTSAPTGPVVTAAPAAVPLPISIVGALPVLPATFNLDRLARVRGSSQVGHKLKVRAAKVSPAAVKVTYTWRRDGRRIRGAKHSSYRLTAADLGSRISVRLRYRTPGYVDLVVITRIGRIRQRVD